MNPTSDWYELEKIADGGYQITEGRGALPCNSFLLDGGEEALLIDTGLGVGDLYRFAGEVIDAVPSVFLTHSHWDHIGAAHQFDDVVIDDRERTPNGRVTIDVLSDEFVERPSEFVASWRELGRPFPTGFDPDGYDIPATDDVGTVAPGDDLVVGDHELELLHVPGHSPGQLAALDAGRGVLYGADAIGIGSSLYAHFQDSDVAAYVETFETLADLYEAGAFDTLTTGHNDPIRGSDLEVLEEMRVALGDVLDGTAEYEVVDTDWGPARNYAFDGFTVLTKMTVT